MKEYYGILRASPLFEAIPTEEYESLLQSMHAYVQAFVAGELIYRAGDEVVTAGIVLKGKVHIIREEISGSKTIMSEFTESELFAESFSVSNIKRLPVSAEAATACKIMFINYRQLLHSCPRSCTIHARIIENMMMILADKNYLLSRKLIHLSKRTTRDKLLSYLLEQAQRSGGRSFVIPYTRQQLADFLCVDRSAMSNELSKMQSEGLLAFSKNHFSLAPDTN